MGLNVIRVINEPTSASIAHGLDQAYEEAQVLVFDFGGGTLDVTLLDVDQGVFDVLAHATDSQLGGETLNQRVVDKYVQSPWLLKEVTNTICQAGKGLRQGEQS